MLTSQILGGRAVSLVQTNITRDGAATRAWRTPFVLTRQINWLRAKAGELHSSISHCSVDASPEKRKAEAEASALMNPLAGFRK
jgi:hypothetical protein